MTSVQEPAAASAIAPAITFRQLTVVAGRQTLLQNVDAGFQAGKVTLIIGCSGVGKSVLLNAMADLIRDDDDVTVTGEVTRNGASVGVVFQSFALFDELTPRQNVALAAAQRRGPPKDPSTTAELLDELQVPADVPTAALSGGQRQRLAIARALAFDAEVILYDEPTSGLDAQTGSKVAELIRRAHDEHHKTSIIVTHDFATLTCIADEVFLLDAATRSLRRIPPEQWPELHELLVPPAQNETPARWSRGWLQALGGLFEATTRACERTVTLPLHLLPLWRSPAWGLRCLLHYLRIVAGPSAWLYLAITGAIIGFVTTYFTFKYLPFADYTEPLLLEELLGSIGFALYRIFVPVLATILIAARCGGAVASDIGGKSYGRQLDAMKTLGMNPPRYLKTGILYSFLFGAPVLTLVAYGAAAMASLVVFTATHLDRGSLFWNHHFHAELTNPGSFWFAGTGWLLAKLLICAVGIAAISYHRGATRKYSTGDVSRGITSTILWSTLYVLVVHFAFAFFEF